VYYGAKANAIYPRIGGFVHKVNIPHTVSDYDAAETGPAVTVYRREY